MGAVPLKAAKWCRLGKRATSPVIPMAVAATTGPTPKILVVEAPDALDHRGEPLARLLDLGVETAQVVKQLPGELDPGDGHSAVGLH